MTTVPVPGAPGKYEVLFNGSSLPCYDDTDCPGAGICAVNQTWSVPRGGWCMCYTRGGLDGDHCNQVCGLGVARLVLGLITIVMGLIVAYIGILSFYTANRKRKRWSEWFTLLNLTLFTITSGSLFLVAYIIMNLVNTLGFATYYQEMVSRSGRVVKMNPQSHEYATFILLVLAQCVSVCPPLLFPLVWIDLANAAFKFRPSSLSAIKMTSVAFSLLVCFVQFPLYILAVNNYQGQLVYFGEIAATIWYVVYGFLVLLNLAAAAKVLLVRKEVASRPKSEVNERFLSLLDRVFTAASLMAVFFVILIGLIVGSQERQRRTYYNDPTCNVIGGTSLTLSDVCLRIVSIFIQAITAVCLWFIYPDTKRPSTTTGAGTPQRGLRRLAPNRTADRHTHRIQIPPRFQNNQVVHTNESNKAIRSENDGIVQSDTRSEQVDAAQDQIANV